MDWLWFAAALVAFLLAHSLPLRPPVKAWFVAKLGRGGFQLLYSALSLLLLVWVIRAAGEAPYVELWPQAAWQRTLAFYGMLGVCLLLALAIARPNPFSFGGARNESFDPARPGIVRWTRHPLLLGLALWAGLHLLVNGDLARALLFGLFAGFSLLGMAVIDRRKRREMGDVEWSALRHAVKAAPHLAPPLSRMGLFARLALGVAGFLLLTLLHPVVLGVSPMPH
ncbi:MAG: NnrU family protein [Pseudomonadota bacterium]